MTPEWEEKLANSVLMKVIASGVHTKHSTTAKSRCERHRGLEKMFLWRRPISRLTYKSMLKIITHVGN